MKHSNNSNNSGGIGVKMNGYILGDKSSFKMLELSFTFKSDWGSCIFSISKTVPKKIGTMILSMKFFSLVFALYLYKS